jgi:hypothetical protein
MLSVADVSVLFPARVFVGEFCASATKEAPLIRATASSGVAMRVVLLIVIVLKRANFPALFMAFQADRDTTPMHAQIAMQRRKINQ